MNNLSKPVVTICIAIGGASLSGLMYNLMSEKKTKCSKKNDVSPSDDEHSTNVLVETSNCPFANTLCVSVTGGVISGVLSWYML